MKRRLTLRDETGRAILNCYACKTEGRMICDYFSCQQRIIDRLADFEDEGGTALCEQHAVAIKEEPRSDQLTEVI